MNTTFNPHSFELRGCLAWQTMDGVANRRRANTARKSLRVMGDGAESYIVAQMVPFDFSQTTVDQWCRV